MAMAAAKPCMRGNETVRAWGIGASPLTSKTTGRVPAAAQACTNAIAGRAIAPAERRIMTPIDGDRTSRGP